MYAVANCNVNVRFKLNLSFVGCPYRAEVGVRRAKTAFLNGCESHPAMLLQPEAIGAVMEVTKWLKSLM